MINFSLYRMLFFLVAKCDLKCIITISFDGFLLGNYAWTCFDDSNCSLLTSRIKNAGHANFLTNNTFHCIYFVPSATYSWEEEVDGRLFPYLRAYLVPFPAETGRFIKLLFQRLHHLANPVCLKRQLYDYCWCKCLTNVCVCTTGTAHELSY